MPDSVILTHFNFVISVGISQDNTFYYVNPQREPVCMVREFYAGGLYYRIPRTSTRFSRKRVVKDMKPTRLVFRLEPLPF